MEKKSSEDVGVKANTYPLSSVINPDNYYIIGQSVLKNGDKTENYYCPDTGALLKLLGLFGSEGTSAWDTNGDKVINTADYLKYLAGFGVDLSHEVPSFNEMIVDDMMVFGEGNFWLSTPNLDLQFAWLHKTPFDDPGPNSEINNLNSFVLDLIQPDNSAISYTYIRK